MKHNIINSYFDFGSKVYIQIRAFENVFSACYQGNLYRFRTFSHLVAVKPQKPLEKAE